MPLHSNRTWQAPGPPVTPEEAARLLTHMSWCSCASWRVQAPGGQEIILLNDQTGPDGIFEVSVMRREDDASPSEARPGETMARWRQLESLTVPFYPEHRGAEPGELARDLTELSRGEWPEAVASKTTVPLRFHASTERCRHCA